jgi:hypothetical protein
MGEQSSACCLLHADFSLDLLFSHEDGNDILTCMSVTIDGVWIGQQIYWLLTGRNYK